jgi:nicotinic acid mononucleotide adenylyltransferase
MRLRELFESPRTAVMAFGRMNPPTIGHAKLVDAVKSQGGDPYIFLSQSQKPKTDPLAFADKLRYAKFFFPEVTIGNPEVKTIIQALQKINQLGYENLIYVAGSDRVQSFEELINKYNGKDYTFKSIKVVSAGERDPDADGAEGMSASKMRAAAEAGDLESFKQGVPNQEVADEMFAAVRQGMGIRDEEPVAAEAFSPVQWLKNTFSSDPEFKAWQRMYSQDPDRAARTFRTKHKEFLTALQKAGQTEDAPPGREKQVKKLKKKFDDPGAPYAIAWAQHNKHGRPSRNNRG